MPNPPLLPLPLELGFPADAIPLSPCLAAVRIRGGGEGKRDLVVFLNKAGPIRAVDLGDRSSVAAAAVELLELELATAPALSEALDVHPGTIRNFRKRYEEGGLQAVVADGRGKHETRQRKLTPRALARARMLLDAGHSQRKVARSVGVSEVAIRIALADGRLTREEVSPERFETASVSEKSTPSERAREDQVASRAGVGVKRHLDRTMAAVGHLGEASPRFHPVEAVARAGVLLALPVLLDEGLLEVGEKVYGSLSQGFYGLRSILLALAFMALVRVKNPDRLDAEAPGEMGILLGLDRFPEKKTLRRKIAELASMRCAHEFAGELARRFAEEDPQLLGLLYVDGHVRCYHGRKHRIPKGFVQRRKMAMPADTEYWVNDGIGRPLFFVLPDANRKLLSVLEGEILPEVRRLAGEDRRVTLVFDREGWSPAVFEEWNGKGFDVLTYRKGASEDWPEEEFEEVERAVLGAGMLEAVEDAEERLGRALPEAAKFSCRLAQRLVRLRAPTNEELSESGITSEDAEVLGPEGGGFWAREIRRLCPSGHQTAIVTTAEEGGAVELAFQMFARWRQENFFKYLREEFAIDHVVTHAMEQMDPERPVTNPVRKQLEKERSGLLSTLAALEQECGIRKLELEEVGGKPSKRRSRITKADQDILQDVKDLRREIAGLDSQIAKLPMKVPDRITRPKKEIVRRDVERRELTNAIKMLAYRAETWLHRFVTIFLPGWAYTDRAFIKSALTLPADLVPNEESRTLTVRIHPPSTWRWKQGLEFLCIAMTKRRITYPGTDLRLVYEVLC